MNARYENLRKYTIQHIALKLRIKDQTPKICVCVRATERAREIVSEFGGKEISLDDAAAGAFKLASMLTTNDKISIRPELLNFINTHKISIPWQPPVARKPRNVYNI